MKKIFVFLAILFCSTSSSKAEGILDESLKDVEVSGVVRYRFESKSSNDRLKRGNTHSGTMHTNITIN